MLFTAILGVLLNILIAWILAGGGLKLFKEILIGVFFGVSSSEDEEEEEKDSIKKKEFSKKKELKNKNDYDIEMGNPESQIKLIGIFNSRKKKKLSRRYSKLFFIKKKRFIIKN